MIIRYLVCLLLCFAVEIVYAFEVETIQVTSAQDEPFAALVPLVTSYDERLTIHATLAGIELYTLVGIEPHLWLELLQYQQININGEEKVQLYSPEAMPVVENITIPLLFSSSEHKRHQLYLYHFSGGDVTTESLWLFGPVTTVDTLDAISLHYGKRYKIDYLVAMYDIFQRNPHAFFRDNMNNVRANVMLVIPSETQMQAIEKQEAYQAVKYQLEQWQHKRANEKQVMNERELILSKARLQRLALNNDQLRKERSDLQTQLRALEVQMSQVVARVLEPESGNMKELQPRQTPVAISQSVDSTSTSVAIPQASSSGFSSLILLLVISVPASLLWYFRREVRLWIQHIRPG